MTSDHLTVTHDRFALRSATVRIAMTHAAVVMAMTMSSCSHEGVRGSWVDRSETDPHARMPPEPISPPAAGPPSASAPRSYTVACIPSIWSTHFARVGRIDLKQRRIIPGYPTDHIRLDIRSIYRYPGLTNGGGEESTIDSVIEGIDSSERAYLTVVYPGHRLHLQAWDGNFFLVSDSCDGKPSLMGVYARLDWLTSQESSADVPVTEGWCRDIGATLTYDAGSTGPIPLPEQQLTAVFRALQKNDPLAVYRALPADDRWTFDQRWSDTQTTWAEHKPELRAALRILSSPHATATLLPIYLKRLENFDAAAYSAHLSDLAARLPLLVSAEASGDGHGAGRAMTPELERSMATARSLLEDLSAWILTAHVDDRDRLQAAIDAVVKGLVGMRLDESQAGVDALCEMSLPELLARSGPLLEGIKQAMMVYGLGADDFLASITMTSDGEVDIRTSRIGFTAFGHSGESMDRLQYRIDKWVSLDQAGVESILGGVLHLGQAKIVPSSLPPVDMDP